MAHFFIRQYWEDYTSKNNFNIIQINYNEKELSEIDIKNKIIEVYKIIKNEIDVNPNSLYNASLDEVLHYMISKLKINLSYEFVYVDSFNDDYGIFE